MAVAELLENMNVDTAIPIFINKNFDIFLLNCYVCGYHAYIDVWNAIINDSLHCKNEEGNEFGTTSVALIRDGCLKQNIVGHVSVHLSITFYRFLKLPGRSISVTTKKCESWCWRWTRDSSGIQVHWRQKGGGNFGENAD